MEEFHGVSVDDFIFIVDFHLLVGFDDVVEHLSDFLGNKGQGPTENVQKVGEKVWVLLEIELLNIDFIFLNRIIITTNLITAALLL